MIDVWGNWWNLRQSKQISQQKQKSGQIEARVTSVDDRLERLQLISMAIWEIMQETNGVADETLRRKIEEIDLRDGRLDGKISSAPLTCQQCGRNFSRRHVRCIYCGDASNGSPFSR